jgi:hypothetical protein
VAEFAAAPSADTVFACVTGPMAPGESTRTVTFTLLAPF